MAKSDPCRLASASSRAPASWPTGACAARAPAQPSLPGIVVGAQDFARVLPASEPGGQDERAGYLQRLFLVGLGAGRAPAAPVRRPTKLAGRLVQAPARGRLAPVYLCRPGARVVEPARGLATPACPSALSAGQQWHAIQLSTR